MYCFRFDSPRTTLRRTPFTAFVLACVAMLYGVAHAAEITNAHRILPESIALVGPHASQRLTIVQVQRDQNANQVGGQVAPKSIQWSIDRPTVATLEGQRVVARGDGTAQLTGIILDERGKELERVASTIKVSGCEQPATIGFRYEVQSIMARLGCNSGACHGALAGKGGFRLSLRGYDAESDWFAITREAQGRRIELSDPGKSLLLTKPTGAVAHKGGIRLDTESKDYQVLAQWIARGAPGPSAKDPSLTHITVTPENSTLKRGEAQQILVQAHFDDGTQSDVTHWAKFSASDEAVMMVDEQGTVSVRGPGEGAIVAWFGSKIALSRITVPFEFEVPESAYAAAPRRNVIDELNLAKLRQLKLEPGKRCTDEEFLRRAMVDTIGRLPTVDEYEKFSASTSTNKRDELIESLLARPEYVDYWAYKWSDLLLVSGNKLRPTGVKAFYKWIREQVENNTPWDQFVEQILTAQGTTSEVGSVNFYAIHQDPEALTENACQAFLGLSIACAKCHNHPLEKWTNDQYYAMANLFARVRGKGWGGDSRNGDGIRTVYVASEGDLIQPRRGKPQPPTPLDGEPMDLNDPSDRRVQLANWMIDPKNPYFARSITNRVWANFFSVGLVEQIDDLRLSNPASNEPLLESVSQYLIAEKFDLKQLMRLILQSETYQRTSDTAAYNEPDKRFYARYYPRRMMAEVLLDGIDQVLDTQTKFEFVAFPGADRQKTDFYPAGTRAIQLYDAAVESYFLKTFGRNSREITCECERSDEPSMVQVLHLANGETLNPKLQASKLINAWMDSKATNETILDQLFVMALSRKPTTTERESLEKTLSEYGTDERRQGLEDLCWSVLVNNEFVFNH